MTHEFLQNFHTAKSSRLMSFLPGETSINFRNPSNMLILQGFCACGKVRLLVALPVLNSPRDELRLHN